MPADETTPTRELYTIDVPLLATIHVDPDADLTKAVDTIRELAGRALDVDLSDGVTLHQVSVRGHRRPGMVLISGPCTDTHLRLDGFQEPQVCRTCRSVYDVTSGEGSDGDCGTCADAAERHTDGDGCAIYDGAHLVQIDGADVFASALDVGDVFTEDDERWCVDAVTPVRDGGDIAYHVARSPADGEE